MRTVIIGLLFVIGTAHAETAEEILSALDRAHSSFKDLTIDSKMTIREPGAADAREFVFTTIMKGEQKRLVRFSAPADIRGMGMLAEGRDTLYVFLPGFQRVRRLGTHVKNQTFMGSDFSYEDMTESTYTGYYRPKLAGAEGAASVLELELLPGKEAEYPKLKIWVDKSQHNQATKIEFYDSAGKKARTMTRTGYRKDEGAADHYSPEFVTVTDHRRNDHSTTVQLVRARANTGVADDLFTQRSLIRGQ